MSRYTKGCVLMNKITDIGEKNKKVFENWDTVDCNDCEKYWLNQCDGVKCDKTHRNGATRLCNSFKATRSVIIPLKLKRLTRAFKAICAYNAILTIIIIWLMWEVLK